MAISGNDELIAATDAYELAVEIVTPVIGMSFIADMYIANQSIDELRVATAGTDFVGENFVKS